MNLFIAARNSRDAKRPWSRSIILIGRRKNFSKKIFQCGAGTGTVQDHSVRLSLTRWHAVLVFMLYVSSSALREDVEVDEIRWIRKVANRRAD